MKLWLYWWQLAVQLRPACSRLRTFLWLAVCLMGMTVRHDLFGVSSIIRALGLKGLYYDRILDFFHSSALKIEKLTRIWVCIILKRTLLLRVNGKMLLIGDGIKIPKQGKKMPAVKKLHQESESNSKPEYIFGHSCQAIAILAGTLKSMFAIPLASRIHEGVVFSNRDSRTLLDKMIELIMSLGIEGEFYFIADAYYAGMTMVNGLLEHSNHLITRVRRNAVAYLPVEVVRTIRRGRPKRYGDKVKLRRYFADSEEMQTAKSPVYSDNGCMIQYKMIDLLWRPVGKMIRFVFVIHPERGKIMLMSTDTTLSAIDIIRIYGLRFKIEVSFKQSLNVIGVYAYHFWIKVVKPLRKNSGNQYFHRESEEVRNAVRRKLSAYHAHIQIGLIAQGLVQCLSLSYPKLVWAHFGSWIRTIRPGLCPSEGVTVNALRNSLPEFLLNSTEIEILKKFLTAMIDADRIEGVRLVA